MIFCHWLITGQCGCGPAGCEHGITDEEFHQQLAAARAGAIPITPPLAMPDRAILALSLFVRAMGYEAENQNRLNRGEMLCYLEESFEDLASQIEALVKEVPRG